MGRVLRCLEAWNSLTFAQRAEIPLAMSAKVVFSRFDPLCSGSGVVHTVVGSNTDSRKVCGHIRRDPQRPGTGMPDESARYLKEPPAHGGDTMTLPVLPQSGVFEEDEEIMSDDADPEESRISALLTTGHPLHAKADFEFLDTIL